ncbi:hypothetical protein [Fastidiosibacter lacustris]|uniref:hypothetical protein n=1 Tax=Fastidiosibacter lacustris TaxID=2056695 RepID=UPI000E355185|nr:hypothetical protein [Fastidiosibacter lacustris]
MPDVYIQNLTKRKETQEVALKTLRKNGIDVQLNGSEVTSISVINKAKMKNHCFVFEESLLQDSFFIRLLKELINCGINCALQVGDFIYEYVLKPFRREENNKVSDPVENKNNQNEWETLSKANSIINLEEIEASEVNSKIEVNKVNNEDDEFCIINKTDCEGMNKEFSIKKSEVNSFEDTLTSKVNLAKFIKDKILGHLPQTVRNGGLGGGFERGTILIKGLTQQEACAIYEFLKPNGAAASYQRLSTHGDLVWGVDLDQNQYILTKDGRKFRHLLFSMPQPYEGEIHDASEAPILEKVQHYVTDSEYKDKPFYIRLKPESYGMNDVLSIIGHSVGYLHTRIFSGYKQKPGYYGEGEKSKNGEFVIDLRNPAKQEMIEPIFNKNKSNLKVQNLDIKNS